MKIGIIGLGDIGGNLAAWLAGQGWAVTGYDIDAAASARAAGKGVGVAPSRAALIEQSELVVTSLPSLGAIEESYFAPDGLVAAGRPDLLTVECSTVPPDLARRITTERIAAGGGAIEASVIGIGKDAAAGALFFMVAGDAGNIDRARPFLDGGGRGWRHVGDSGTASITKVLNNAVGAVTLCAIAEALAFAEANGIAPDVLVDVMQKGAGAGASVVLDRHGIFMAGAAPARPYNPISLKDSQALGDLLTPALCRDLPMLATMTETYRHVLAGSKVAVPERLTAEVRDRLSGTPSAGTAPAQQQSKAAGGDRP